MKPSHFLALCCIAVPLWACEKKETPATVTPPASVAAPPPASAAAAADRDDLSLEEDFEDEAEQKISSQNAEAELDKLEKEISE